MPFRGWRAVGRAAIGGALSLIPFVGWLLLSGYALRVVRETERNGVRRLPGWRSPGELALDGLRIWLVQIAFLSLSCLGGLAGLALLIGASLIAGRSPLDWGGASGGPFDLGLAATLPVVVVPVGILALLVPLATMQLAARGIPGAFDVAAHWRNLRGDPGVVFPVVVLNALLTGALLLLPFLSGDARFPVREFSGTLEPTFLRGGSLADLLLPGPWSLVGLPLHVWCSLTAASAIGLGGRRMGVRPG